jgi:hypothetical protein
MMFAEDPPDKSPSNSDALVRVAHFVDTASPNARDIIASTAGYTLAESGALYFDYVILSGGEIKQGAIDVYVEYSAELRAILKDWAGTISPLREKGIKVLIGITGGRDGVSVGSLTGWNKDQLDSMAGGGQEQFARICASALPNFGVDGLEFYDVDCSSNERTPYPAMGTDYWDGEAMISIAADAADAVVYDAWKKGGAYYANMLSYLIIAMGASSSFQGDIDPNQKEKMPILVRETNYGQWIQATPPRLPFATTGSCLTYIVNDDAGRFGPDPDHPNSRDRWIGNRQYAPAKIDLAAASDAEITEYSRRLGRGDYGDEDADGDEREGDCQYGLVYYVNLGLPSDAQTRKLSETSKEIFGEAVVVLGN